MTGHESGWRSGISRGKRVGGSQGYDGAGISRGVRADGGQGYHGA